MTNDQCLIA